MTVDDALNMVRIGNWIEYYNHARKHQTLGTTPELMYAASASLRKAA
jgi:hypothetical protein